MDGVLHDLRYGFRGMLRNPAYATTAVLTLALGIGASTAVFSLVNTIVLRPLPFRRPEQLVWVSSRRSSPGELPFSLPDFIDYRDQNHTLAGIAAFGGWSANLTGRGDPQRLEGLRISANAFEVLGVTAVAGRTLQPADDTPSREHVVVLGFRLWQRRFGADPTLIGQTLTLNDAAYTVVGVLPPQFIFPYREAELAVPLAPDADPWRNDRTSVNFLRAVARVRPGTTRERAEADLDVVAARLRRQYPEGDGKKLGVRLTPLQDELVGDFRFALWVLLGAVGVLLLISCVNLAGLALVRATARQQEFAIRTAVGATGPRLVRQLATESLLLAGAGGGAGVLLAMWTIPLLLAVGPRSLPRAVEVGVDVPVLGFALAITLVTAVLFGLAPAWRATRVNLGEALKEDGRGASGGARRQRARRLLVVSEIALSVVLLTGAGLLVRSFLLVQAVHPGFDARDVLAVRLSLPRARYSGRAAVTAFYERLRQRLESLPGVESVGFVSVLPLSGFLSSVPFSVEGRPTLPNEDLVTNYRLVGAGYFRALRIPLIAGRVLDERDRGQAAPVALVSEGFARRYWPRGGAVGAHLRLDDSDQPPRLVQIVGVVGDLRDLGLEGEPAPHVYVPLDQVPEDGAGALTNSQYWLLRTTVDPMTLADAVRREIRAVDSNVPASTVRTMEQYLSASVASRRFNLWLLMVFAGVALVLAGTGLYGVISYDVTQRRREIGIRMALGAQPGDVFRLVIGQGMRLAVAGVALGVGAALAMARLITSLLFGVGATDPPTFVGVALLQMLVALIACYVPARRATRLDPIAALR
jgi:putative ABC transport system permease protein